MWLRCNKGFSLLEVLIAVVILGFVMASVSTVSNQLLRSKQQVEHRAEVLQMGRAALHRMETELQLSFMTRAARKKITGISASTGIIEEGAWKTFFIGENHGEQDSLRFTTLSHLRYYKDAQESDQSKVSYVMRPSQDEDADGLFDLIRVEQVWLDGRTEVEGRDLVLAAHVRSFHVEYYDPRKDEWVPDWDTENIDDAGKLPQAVRIQLTFPDPDDPEQDLLFETGVSLALAEPIQL